MAKQEDAPEADVPADLWLELEKPDEADASSAFGDYLHAIANRGLRRYREIVQTGKKEGQTYYTHILDGVTTIERLRGPLGLDDDGEPQDADRPLRCLFLAFTLHDINKIPEYQDARGRPRKYVDIASPENIEAELVRLGADDFWSRWRDYLRDIVALARLHQGHRAVTTEGLDRRPAAAYLLDADEPGRVARLGYLMEAVDVLALSETLDDREFKGRFLNNLNAASTRRRYRFVTHRLSENRGLLTNVIHNAVVSYLREKHPGCLDLLYYPDGVAYLVPEDEPLAWEPDDLAQVARHVASRLAELQREELGQFIKARPVAIVVDAAALESGADPATILETVYSVVLRKRYTEERESARASDVRTDLRAALDGAKISGAAAELARDLAAADNVLPRDEQHLRLADYAAAYRKLLEDHGAKLGKRLDDTWGHVYQLLGLPADHRPLYDAVNTFRRAFFIVRDLPQPLPSLEALHERCVRDLVPDEAAAVSTVASADDGLITSLTEYLERTLEVSTEGGVRRDLSAYLRRYVTERNRQCCNCSTVLPTQEWMTANAPPSIGVQSFSNRLEGAGLRDPKRQICAICRAQFILEKLAWAGHSSKQGMPRTRANGTKEPGYTTFYLYLYPHAYFTEPFLSAWAAEVERLRDQDTRAFLLDTARAFREWNEEGRYGALVVRPTKINGVAVPRLAEATRNVPLLPINAPGGNYGEQFLLALEKAVLLRRFFGCRVVLSRLPSPPVDAGGFDVLFVDSLPRNLYWLIAGPGGGAAAYQHAANLTADQAEGLEGRLRGLHTLSGLLHVPGSDRDLVHDLAVAAADEPMRLFFELDRAIETKVASEGKGGSRAGTGRKALSAEVRATALSRLAAPIAGELVASTRAG